ncbi:MAG: GNAT family N-acetyltransferase [Patescibacteria group bacterium]|nr:GNAT family N-acetyltransferase [Patescibacteria group bacterium]
MFHRNFNFYTTDSPEELKEIYKIRYQVYCLEYNYLNKEDYPNELEKDEYDSKSIHFILRHKSDNEIAATVRFILNSEIGLPIEKHFNIGLQVPVSNRDRLAEISRLIVANKYRRKFLLLAQIKGLYAYSKHNDITQVYSVLDDKLFPVLKKIGFPFKKIGPQSVYQGLTSPYIMDIAEMEENLKIHNPALYKYIVNGILIYNGLERNYSIH